MGKLPNLPGHRIELVRKHKPGPEERTFLELAELELRVRFANGEVSETFPYSVVVRERLDAVVIVPHFRAEDGTTMVVLVSSIRPPAALRPGAAARLDARASHGEIWEVPAGLVEPDEVSP